MRTLIYLFLQNKFAESLCYFQANAEGLWEDSFFLEKGTFLLLNDNLLGSSILCNHKFPSISPWRQGQKVLVQKHRNLELFWVYRFKQSHPIGGLVRSGLNQQPKTQSNKLGSNSSWRQWDISHAQWDQMPYVLILRRPQDCCSPLPVTVTVASFFGWLVRSWNTAEGMENMSGGLMGTWPRMWLQSCEFESLLEKRLWESDAFRPCGFCEGC